MGKAKILYVKTKAGDDVLRAVGTLTSGITTPNTPPLHWSLKTPTFSCQR